MQFRSGPDLSVKKAAMTRPVRLLREAQWNSKGADCIAALTRRAGRLP
jgi:hypothetical protein